LFFAASALCLAGALIPALGYGIYHSGVVLLFIASAAFLSGGVMWIKMGKRVKTGLLFIFCSFIIYGGFCSALMAWHAYFSHMAGGDIPVVVLGAKTDGEYPSLILARRLRAAEGYLRENSNAVCVVSGGQGKGPREIYPEAYVMALWLERQGIDPSRILQESRSTNTMENLAFSAGILGHPDEVAIATDGFHQYRASLYASGLGMKAYSVASHTPWGLAPAYWAREWLALPVAWIKS